MRNKSFHVHKMDGFTIKAIKYIATLRGESIGDVIAGAINAEINEYPDLARARDQIRFQHEVDAGRPVMGGR